MIRVLEGAKDLLCSLKGDGLFLLVVGGGDRNPRYIAFEVGVKSLLGDDLFELDALGLFTIPDNFLLTCS